MIPWDLYKSYIPSGMRRRLVALRHGGIWRSIPAGCRDVLVHIPKTAGTSLAHSLYGHDINHYPMWVWRDANPALFAESRFIVVIRDPLERLISAIRHCMGSERASKRDLQLGRYLSTQGDNLDEILDSYLGSAKIRTIAQSSIHFKPYSYWFDIDDCSGRLLCFRLSASAHSDNHVSPAPRLNVNDVAPSLTRSVQSYRDKAIPVLREDYDIWRDERLVDIKSISEILGFVGPGPDNISPFKASSRRSAADGT